jgi:hypothetical protein
VRQNNRARRPRERGLVHIEEENVNGTGQWSLSVFSTYRGKYTRTIYQLCQKDARVSIDGDRRRIVAV